MIYPDGVTGEFYQKFREELTAILLNVFQKIAEEGKHPNSLYEATITLGEGNGTPLQYSCLENPMEGCSPWGNGESDMTTFTFRFHALEKEMATHSSVLAWRIPGMVEPGRLPSVGSHRVGHD